MFLVSAVSCVNYESIEVLETIKSNESVSVITADVIPVNEALSALDKVLANIDLPTRGRCRKAGKVTTVTKERMFGVSSRVATSVPEGDLLYVVNFENNSGYAILGANNALDTVIMVGDSGNFDDSVFCNNDNLPDMRVTLADIYCEEDDEYYLGSCNMENITGGLIKDFVRVRTDFNDGEFEIEGSGVACIRPLLKTLWSQSEPFNLRFHFAPASDTNNQGRRPAGCTTIAAAQIITYLKNIDLENQFGITASTWQDIESVDASDTDGVNQSSKDVAFMIKQMADSIGVKYNFLASGGTFATPQKVKRYLEKIGYDVTKYLGCKEIISDRIVKSLEIGSPVFIGALSPDFSGHA